MSDILSWGSSPSERWMTESREQYCTFAAKAPLVPPHPAYTPMFMPSGAPAPAAQPIFVPATDAAAAAAAYAAAAATVPPPAAAAPPAAEVMVVAEDITDAPPATAEAVEEPTKPTKRTTRPPFHTYGRANVKPIVGGFCYGDYLATHNAKAGHSVPMVRREGGAAMGPAQVHYMEADMRASARRYFAKTRPTSAPAPEPAPAPAAPPAEAVAAAPPAPADHYAALPAYDPTAFSAPTPPAAPPPPPTAPPPMLPYYPPPLDPSAYTGMYAGVMPQVEPVRERESSHTRTHHLC